MKSGTILTTPCGPLAMWGLQISLKFDCHESCAMKSEDIPREHAANKRPISPGGVLSLRS